MEGYRGNCEKGGASIMGKVPITKNLSEVTAELLRAEKEAYAPDRTLVNILGIEKTIKENPEKYPVLAKMTPKHLRQSAFIILQEHKFRPASNKPKGSSRVYWRPGASA